MCVSKRDSVSECVWISKQRRKGIRWVSEEKRKLLWVVCCDVCMIKFKNAQIKWKTKYTKESKNWRGKRIELINNNNNKNLPENNHRIPWISRRMAHGESLRVSFTVELPPWNVESSRNWRPTSSFENRGVSILPQSHKINQNARKLRWRKSKRNWNLPLDTHETRPSEPKRTKRQHAQWFYIVGMASS